MVQAPAAPAATLSSEPPAPIAVQRPRVSGYLPLAAALLFILALLPRLIGLGEATTEDEDQWILRTGNFARALEAGTWKGTYQIGHPGVTTMWLTDFELGGERARRFASGVRTESRVTEVPDFLAALHAARVPFAIANAALVALIALLAARIFGGGPGLLAGLLLALDPYWSAMSPIVGMDGLLAGLSGASLLSALLAFPRASDRAAAGSGTGWAALSGLLAGLALLTKGPALFLFPMVPLLAVLEARRGRALPGIRQAALVKLVLWGLGGIAAAAIWPAMWVDPLGTVQQTAKFVREIGSTPHAPGNYFLGHFVVDPGPLFYPAALALRLGPATFLGVLLLPALPIRRAWRWPIGLLVAYILLFGIGLTISPKKVDRYILPLFPSFAVLAALAWWSALGWLAARLGGRPLLPLGCALLGLLQVWPLVGAAPHPLAAYNPLLGGIRTAELVLPVGWGEGLDLVADELRRRSEVEQPVVAIWYPLFVNFQAHAPGRVLNITFRGPGQVGNQQLLDQADYYVDYIHARQRGFTPRALQARRPDFVVAIAGAEYARVYRLR